MANLIIKNLEKLPPVVNIYIKLININRTSEPLSIVCDDMLVVSGIRGNSDYYVGFYSDINGTIPINVNGMGINVNYETTIIDIINDITTVETYVENGNGVEILLQSGFVDSINELDCNGDEITNITGSVSLLPGDYVII